MLMSISSVTDSIFFAVNETFVETTGFSREMIVGKSALKLGIIGSIDRLRILKEVKANGRIRNAEVQLRRAELARLMLQIRPDLPIILCTGYSNLISKEKAKAMGIKGFALKPLARKDLSNLVRKVLDGR